MENLSAKTMLDGRLPICYGNALAGENLLPKASFTRDCFSNVPSGVRATPEGTSHTEFRRKPLLGRQ